MTDIRVPAGLGLLAGVVLLVPLGSGVGHLVQVAVGVPFALVLPGYMITRAIFPLVPAAADGADAGPPSCTPLQRICWVVALDMALLTVGALVLNATPDGVGRATWVLFLCLSVETAGLIARRRERGLAPPPSRRWRRPTLGRVVAATVAAAIATGAIGLSIYTEATKAEPGFSQLWLVPDATATAAPPTPAAPRAAQLGVLSSEEGTRDFRVEVRAEGTPVQSWSFSLAPGDEWTQSVEVRRGTRTEAVLYREPGATPYRAVWTGVP